MQTLEDQLVFLCRCFVWANREENGFLAGHDLKCGVAAALGVRPSKVRGFELVLTQMFRGCQIPGHELCVTMDEFVTVMRTRLDKTDLLEAVRRLFKAMDLRAEGFISRRSFEQACEMTLPFANRETLLRVFREADRDDDGRVTYQDFERMCLLAVQVDASNNK